MALPSRNVKDPAAQQNFEFLGGLILSGKGDPTGVVAAKVGALWLRQDGGAGSTLYVKESGGSGRTGWVAK